MGWQSSSDPEQGPAKRPHEGSVPDPDAAFWASPVGDAARARLRGDRFFQVELDDATLTAYAEAAVGVGGGRRARRTCDLLGQIEELGWHLEHVTWWKVDDADPAAGLGAETAIPEADHVRGVYLFHAVDTADTVDAPTAADHVSVTPATHVPTHRREVG